MVHLLAGILRTCYHNQVLKMMMGPTIIQHEYSLALLRQSSLLKFPLTIIDKRKMHSILKTPWFLELSNHEHSTYAICLLLSKHKTLYSLSYSFIHSLACAECSDSLLFSGSSSISLCCVLFPSTLFCHLVSHPSSPHFAIYFSALLFPNSYTIFWEFSVIPFSVHAQNQCHLFSLILCYSRFFKHCLIFFIR